MPAPGGSASATHTAGPVESPPLLLESPLLLEPELDPLLVSSTLVVLDSDDDDDPPLSPELPDDPLPDDSELADDDADVLLVLLVTSLVVDEVGLVSLVPVESVSPPSPGDSALHATASKHDNATHARTTATTIQAVDATRLGIRRRAR
jgi:hypothetical protein